VQVQASDALVSLETRGAGKVPVDLSGISPCRTSCRIPAEGYAEPVVQAK
jgi:hypothetical protein